MVNYRFIWRERVWNFTNVILCTRKIHRFNIFKDDLSYSQESSRIKLWIQATNITPSMMVIVKTKAHVPRHNILIYTPLYSIGIPIINIRRSHDRLFIMEIPYLERTSLYWNGSCSLSWKTLQQAYNRKAAQVLKHLTVRLVRSVMCWRQKQLIKYFMIQCHIKRYRVFHYPMGRLIIT